ncbi:MOSC domain-containing protein [Nocardioides campestrisoli]|nr:MOSC domain-containing protein [Nocardioides campestrisoli]
MDAQVLAVNVGKAETGPWTGRVGRSGIRKLAVDGPVMARRTGMAGDTVCDRKFHGGPNKAVYAFAREDLDHWQEELGRPVPDGHFGENLTTSGIDLNAALLGERWRVGAALLEVSTVRTPCRVFAGWMGLTGYDDTAWIKRFTAHGHPGAYLRVLEEGAVERGDGIEVVERPDHDVTIELAFRAFTTERALLPALLVVEDLSEDLRRKAVAYLAH